MPTKRELADAAYERQEDQRALDLVLRAAADFSIELKDGGGADEIMELDRALDRVRARFLTVSPVVQSAELPGQLAIDGSVAGEPRELGAPMAEAFDVPKQCPGCGEHMLLVWGGSWVPMSNVERTDSDREHAHALQCAYCARVEWVSAAAYEAVLAERRRTVGSSDAKPLKVTRTRTRGAG